MCLGLQKDVRSSAICYQFLPNVAKQKLHEVKGITCNTIVQVRLFFELAFLILILVRCPVLRRLCLWWSGAVVQLSQEGTAASWHSVSAKV